MVTLLPIKSVNGQSVEAFGRYVDKYVGGRYVDILWTFPKQGVAKYEKPNKLSVNIKMVQKVKI